MSNVQFPKHIAFIMDGNGRWARKRGLPRVAGHRQGISRVKEIIKYAANQGLVAVTFYAFSTENWLRPKQEVDTLMRYLESFLGKEVDELHRNNIRFLTIGREDPIPKKLQLKIKAAQKKTAANTGLTVILALNYGGRQEIVDAAKRFAREVSEGKLKIEELEPDTFSQFLYTSGIPDPDILVRTSGEVRISNFLLWQLSYAEFFFPNKFWPDFGADELAEIIRQYQARERRFGNVHAD